MSKDFIADLIEKAVEKENAAIEAAVEEGRRRLAFLKKIAELKKEKYPDLRVEYSLDKTVEYFCSREINKIANNYHIAYRLRCPRGYSGDPVFVSPYVEEGGIKIYSSPRQIQIATIRFCSQHRGRSFWVGDINYEELLRSRDISEEMIKKVTGTIKQNSQCEYCACNIVAK